MDNMMTKDLVLEAHAQFKHDTSTSESDVMYVRNTFFETQMFELASQPTWFIKFRIWICTQIVAVLVVSLLFTAITTPMYCYDTAKKINAKITSKDGKDMSKFTVKDWFVVVLTLVAIWFFFRGCIALYTKLTGKISSLDKYTDKRRELIDELMRRGAYAPTPPLSERIKNVASKLNPMNWFKKKQ